METKLPLEINWKQNLFFVWISQFLAMAGFGCCMPFIPLLLKDNLHIVDDQIRGVCVSAYYMAGMTSLCVGMAVWGMLADKFGRKIMLLRASYAAALFYPLLAFAPNFATLITIRFVCSFFSGTVNPAQTLLVSTTPSEKHGFVLGTLSTAIWSGDMFGYLAGGLIVDSFGYTPAFLICGAAYLLSGVLVHIFVRENFKRPEKKKAAEKGSIRSLLTPGIAWLMVMFLFMGISRRIDSPFLAMQTELLVPHDRAAFYTGIASAGAALGGVFAGILIGYLCDRFAPRKLAIPILFFSAAFTFAQAYAQNVETLIVARFLTFFAAGGLQPVLQVMLTKIISPERRGTFLGWSASLSTVGGFVCSLLSGTIAYLASVRSIFAAGAVTLVLMIPLMIPTIRAVKKEFPPGVS